jgi:hypothetical protein
MDTTWERSVLLEGSSRRDALAAYEAAAAGDRQSKYDHTTLGFVRSSLPQEVRSDMPHADNGRFGSLRQALRIILCTRR